MSLPTYEHIYTVATTKVTPPLGRVTRSGIRKYLMRIAAERWLTPSRSPGWYKLWQQIEWTRGMAEVLKVEIPMKLWEEDKARLSAKLAIADYYPDADNPHIQRERKRALRWTRRRSQPS